MSRPAKPQESLRFFSTIEPPGVQHHKKTCVLSATFGHPGFPNRKLTPGGSICLSLKASQTTREPVVFNKFEHPGFPDHEKTAGCSRFWEARWPDWARPVWASPDWAQAHLFSEGCQAMSITINYFGACYGTEVGFIVPSLSDD